MSTSRWSTRARSSSSGSACTSWSPAPTMRSSTTPRSSAGHRAGGRHGHPHRRRRPARGPVRRRALPYDYLIYAVGSGSGAATVPGADEFAYPIADLEEARRFGAALDDCTTARRCAWSGRADRHRDRGRAGRAGPRRHAGVRRRPRAVPEHAGPPVGGQAAAQARRRDRRRTQDDGDGGRRRRGDTRPTAGGCRAR